LRGTVCLYQGEELGLPEANVAFEDLQDPYGITMWPEYKGRDGCRTPMPWKGDAPHAGFSDASRTWLPLDAAHRALAVDQQAGHPGSLLGYFTQLLAWRKQQPALIHGSMTVWPSHPQVLVFERTPRPARAVRFQFQRCTCPYRTACKLATSPYLERQRLGWRPTPGQRPAL